MIAMLEPWFVLNEVCGVLGLTSTSQVKARLDQGVISIYPLQTSGGTQDTNAVNEDGLYDVILERRILKIESDLTRKWGVETKK